ncbi:DNA-binding protein [Clostridium sp. WILCCON 0269]|uniref:DNA-binding protein n=1 Tax=Candidatus Clostridium eludens TaxID=3381663 RepID=A0ABW8SNH9_9CLOT
MEDYKTTESMKHDKKKTMTVAEFMEEYQFGQSKAYQVIHAKDFPVVFCGRKALIIRSKVDDWFLKHIGERF